MRKNARFHWLMTLIMMLALLPTLLPLAPSVLAEGHPTPITCAPMNALHWVSVRADGQGSLNNSFRPSLSADGRYVAFDTAASLVAGDGDNFYDIYLYDRQTCTIELISVSTAGIKGNDSSNVPSISGDGRFVAFSSYASNLVTNDTNSASDVFLRDRQLGTTIRVSVSSAGVEGNGSSLSPSLAANGQYVAFSSNATNLIPTDTNSEGDIFVRNLISNTTARISVISGGGQAVGGGSNDPAISSNGRYVTFNSFATNLVGGDTNGVVDIFVRDRQLNTTIRVSVATGGIQSNGGITINPAISADGRYVAFESTATNFVTGDTANGDVFLHDTTTTTTIRASSGIGSIQSDDDSGAASISADGRYVAFTSLATNLVTGDTNGDADVFLFDTTTGLSTRASVSNSGDESNNNSSNSAFSADGRYLVFDSLASNLVVGDSGINSDVFVRPLAPHADDTLALFNPPFNQVNLLDTLTDNPTYTAHSRFSAYAPVSGGQWVMGDWNGDGLKTPGVYMNGPFYYTNVIGESLVSDWRSLWIGVAGAPVAGQFDDALPNDCIGAVQSASFPPYGLAFVLYYTCDLSGTAAPTITNQWLSVVLPDSGGFSGTHQFAAGDFDSDGDDSVAVRRGTTIAFGNIAPVDGSAAFDLAQYIGAPGTGSDGIIVTGDWDANGVDSFGLFYQNGEFYYRNDLDFNSGVYVNQTVGAPFGTTTIQATTWR